MIRAVRCGETHKMLPPASGPFAVGFASVSVGGVNDSGIDCLGAAVDQNGEKHAKAEEEFCFHLV